MTEPDPSFDVRRSGDGIVVVSIARPAKRNALLSSGWDDLVELCKDIASRPDDRVVILTGAGDVFCAGADLDDPEAEEATRSTGKAISQMRRVGAAAVALHELPQPTIAAVNGHAVGAGACLALGCDFVVAAEEATLRFPFVGLGLVVDSGGSWILPRMVGLPLAKRLVMLGERLTAEAADQLGLLTARVERARVMDEALLVAGRLLKSPPLSLMLAKRVLAAAPQQSLAEAVAAETIVQALALGTADCQEALTAFGEHRPPRFVGS